MTMRKKVVIISSLILGFLIIVLLVINKNAFVVSLDNSINNFMLSHQFPSFTGAMLSITNILNPFEAFVIFIMFGLFLLLKNKKYFYTFTIATALGTLLPIIIKLSTLIQRPGILIEQDYSFPSGHATIATVFLLSSIYLLTPYIKKGFSKYSFILITSIVFPLVAFSRIYLSIHWTSDVIAGIILGLVCFIFAKIICCYNKENVL
jgi:undecaprenyl-diphosphatase